jgi:two-component system response regulator AtoC
VQHLLAKINEKVHKQVTTVPVDVMRHLCALHWPGNVRELENVLTRAVVLSPGGVLLREYLPSFDNEPNSLLRKAKPEPLASLAEVERVHILRALDATSGHKGKACQLLGISRPTLERKLRKYRHGLSTLGYQEECPNNS